MSTNEVKEKLSIVFRAILLTSVILISFFAGHAISNIFHYQSNDISGLWCAITAVVVFDDHPENSKNLVRDRLLGTFLGAIIGGAVVSLLGHLFFSLCLALFIVSVLISVFKWPGALKIACVTVLMVSFTTYDYSIKEIWVMSGMRFVVAVIGGTISLVATALMDKGRALGFFVKNTENSSTA